MIGHENISTTLTTKKIFVSHSYPDSRLVEVFMPLISLDAEFLWDRINFHFGPYKEEIQQAIQSCKLFVIFWSEHTAKSRAIQQEIQWALYDKKPIFSVLLDDTPLIAELSGDHWYDLKIIANYYTQIPSLTPIQMPGPFPPLLTLENYQRAKEMKGQAEQLGVKLKPHIDN